MTSKLEGSDYKEKNPFCGFPKYMDFRQEKHVSRHQKKEVNKKIVKKWRTYWKVLYKLCIYFSSGLYRL